MITLHPSEKRGRVYVRESVDARFWRFVTKTDTCWLWTGATTTFGHGCINTGGKYGRTERAHRLSWRMHFGEIPEGLCVCHTCDVPACVNPAHLFLGTHADNNRDMQAKGRYDRVKRPKGARHWGAKLTDADVLAIRAAFAAGATQTEIAANYAVRVQSIHRIVHRKSWAHV
jgi:hypothetical protein